MTERHPVDGPDTSDPWDVRTGYGDNPVQPFSTPDNEYRTTPENSGIQDGYGEGYQPPTREFEQPLGEGGSTILGE